MSEHFTLDMFTEKLNSTFVMHYGNGQTRELKLVSATDVGSSPRQIQFSCVFQGPADGPAFQSIFSLEHETLGTLSLFLVPIGKDADGIQYEAVFNRVLE